MRSQQLREGKSRAASLTRTRCPPPLPSCRSYFAFKFGFLVYCFLPQTKGAVVIYTHFIVPFLKTHESQIDAAASSASAAASAGVDAVKRAAKAD